MHDLNTLYFLNLTAVKEGHGTMIYSYRLVSADNQQQLKKLQDVS